MVIGAGHARARPSSARWVAVQARLEGARLGAERVHAALEQRRARGRPRLARRLTVGLGFEPEDPADLAGADRRRHGLASWGGHGVMSRGVGMRLRARLGRAVRAAIARRRASPGRWRRRSRRRPAEPVRTASRATAGCSPSGSRCGPGSSRRSARTGTGGCRPSVPVRRLSGFRPGQARAAIRRRSPPGLAREEVPDGHGGGGLLAARGKLSCARVVRTTRAQDTRVSVSVFFSFSVSVSVFRGANRAILRPFVREFRPARPPGDRVPSAIRASDARGHGNRWRRPPEIRGLDGLRAARSAAKRAERSVYPPARSETCGSRRRQPAAAAAVRAGTRHSACVERSAELLHAVRREPGLLASVGQPRADRAGARARLHAEPD